MARRGLGHMVAPAGSREDVFELGPIPVGPLAWWIGTVAAKASGSNKALIPILVVGAVAAVVAADSGDEADRGKSRRERAKAGTIGGGDRDKKDTKKKSSSKKSRRKKKGSKDEVQPEPDKPSSAYTEPGVG